MEEKILLPQNQCDFTYISGLVPQYYLQMIWRNIPHPNISPTKTNSRYGAPHSTLLQAEEKRAAYRDILGLSYARAFSAEWNTADCVGLKT